MTRADISRLRRDRYGDRSVVGRGRAAGKKTEPSKKANQSEEFAYFHIFEFSEDEIWRLELQAHFLTHNGHENVEKLNVS